MSAPERFRDRAEAGRLLGERLQRYAGRDDVIVLALPRGGVPVGRELARALGAPLDVFVVRKLGLPGQEELAMGALASGGARVVNEPLAEQLGLSDAVLDRAAEREQVELERRERLYRGDRPPAPVAGRVVLLVDDGLATGSTMRAAVAALRMQGPARIVAAVPTAPPQTCAELAKEVDEIECLMQPQPFHAVGLWYHDFSEVSDDEVRRMLAVPVAREVAFQTNGSRLEGVLTLPVGSGGLVVFAHGSGSSRLSPRNRRVASVLNDAGIGTYLVDLLTADEEEADRHTGHLRFDVELLAGRLLAAAGQAQEEAPGLALGFFGASTGAGAALVAAARQPGHVRAVVSRGGRPDLAGAELTRVVAPTLLIVGGRDLLVEDLNREAMAQMARAETRLEIVEGASHLFEEPGTLERVAELATDWFLRYLG
jgi:putative phosphoribosyl transferase